MTWPGSEQVGRANTSAAALIQNGSSIISGRNWKFESTSLQPSSGESANHRFLAAPRLP